MNRSFRNPLLWPLLWVLWLVAAPLSAQQAPPPPSAPLAEPAAPLPKVTPQAGVRVRVNRFEIDGNEAFDDDTLRALVGDLEGRDLTLEEIYAASDRVSEYYHRQGYSLSVVTVPAQKVRSGVIRLRVIEGRIGALRYQGNVGYDEAFLDRQLNQLSPGTVVQLQALERELLLLNEMPGLVARSVIQPGADFGSSDLLLKMEERTVEGSVTLDNSGTEAIGEWRIAADLLWNNPTGGGDRLQLGYLHSQGGLLRNLTLGYSTLVGVEGARAGVRYNRADYRVGGAFAPLGIEGKTPTLRLEYSYPLLRGRRDNLQLGAALTRNESESTALGVPVSRSEIDLLELSGAWSRLHEGGSLSTLNALFSTNFSRNDDAAHHDRQRAKLLLDASHERRFEGGWSLFGRAAAVLSPDPLADSQKFSLGGPASVRGYPAATQRGDRGALVSAELRRGVALDKGADALLRLFADVGAVRRIAPPMGETDFHRLAAWGVGVAFQHLEGYTLDIQWADPLEPRAPGEGEGGSRLWVSLHATF